MIARIASSPVLIVVFALTIVALAGARARFAGMMTALGAVILVMVSLIEVTFYLSAVNGTEATTALIRMVSLSCTSGAISDVTTNGQVRRARMRSHLHVLNPTHCGKSQHRLPADSSHRFDISNQIEQPPTKRGEHDKGHDYALDSVEDDQLNWSRNSGADHHQDTKTYSR